MKNTKVVVLKHNSDNCKLISLISPFREFFPNGISLLHGSQVVAYKNLEQVSKNFSRKNRFFNFGSRERAEDTNILKNFMQF